MSTITFGTSGWRAIIAEDFTFANVALATAAVAAHLKGQARTSKGVLFAHDPRFQGRNFAKRACEVMAAAGIKAWLCREDTPTPVVAFEQIRRGLDGAVNFTPSHNPPEYGGLKFNPYWGGPATKDITHDIEAKAAGLEQAGGDISALKFDEGVRKGLIEVIDPKPLYLKRIRELIDFKAIRKAKLKVVADPLYGAGRGYLEVLLKGAVARLDVLHDGRDALFGGDNPEPSEGHIDEMQALVKKSKAHIGLGLDGDADRFGIVDSDGSFILPNLVIALLVRHLSRTRKWEGPVVRSVTSSHFIDAVAEKYGREVIETPVGFKWIGEIMQKRDILIGGEESGGLTVHRHVPEKDGVLACLLMAEMRAVEKKPFRQILGEMYKELGPFMVGRRNFRLSEERKAALENELKDKTPVELAGRKIVKHQTTDGHKFLFEDGSWFAIRFSGTEPVVRLYLEARDKKWFKVMPEAAERLIIGS